MSSYEISKSSLLSLKAEIVRKQEDLAKAKLENVEKIKVIKKKSLELKNKGVELRQLNDLNEEEQDLLKLSRSKLEAKSKLYDQLSGNVQQNDEINRRYLVRFDKKNRTPEESSVDDHNVPEDNEDEEEHTSDYYDEDVNPSEEWVEYTDCLGRSRKCLRKDLEYIKSKDADLKLLAEKRQQTLPPHSEEGGQDVGQRIEDETDGNEGEQGQVTENENEMISGDMRREMLRKQWEREEEELRDKPDIHYQNVLFNEARQHGVGYYAFSKDEQERAAQQEALKHLRTETQQQQKKAQDLKALREKQMAARMKAARNRRRARLGLPPEEDEPTPPPKPSEDPEDEKKKKEENEKQEAIEQMLIEARKRHVRPWDIGKEGVTEFYEMTQEEWNEKQRQERPTEFAPPVAYSTREFSSMKEIECDMDNSEKSLRFSSAGHKEVKAKRQKLRNLNPYKNSKDNINVSILTSNSDHLIEEPSTNMFKNSLYDPEDPTKDMEEDRLLNHYKESRTSVTNITPTPIVNELEEADFDDALLADYHTVMKDLSPDSEERSRRKGTEIAPPPTFEYYGPSETKKARNSSGQINIAESIEAGLKFLRDRAEQRTSRFKDEYV